VSDLIPSLLALLGELPDTAAGRDAAALAAAAGSADGWEEADFKLDGVVRGWDEA
jgi:hypothetical protein